MHMWFGTTSAIMPIFRRRSSSESAQEGLLVADLRIEPGVIRDIVAVHAAGTRHQEWRSVDVGNAKFVQVSGQSRRVLESE